MAASFNLQQPQMGYNMGVNPYNASNYPYENNYMGQQQQTQLYRNQFLKCRPVSSREEAMAFQIDLDGSLYVFPNVANGRIYTKQVNNDGTATFNTYVFSKEEENNLTTEYVTKNEFNKVINSLMAAIQSKSPQSSPALNNNQEISF